LLTPLKPANEHSKIVWNASPETLLYSLEGLYGFYYNAEEKLWHEILPLARAESISETKQSLQVSLIKIVRSSSPDTASAWWLLKMLTKLGLDEDAESIELDSLYNILLTNPAPSVRPSRFHADVATTLLLSQNSFSLEFITNAHGDLLNYSP
jgi:hypothetical protein